MPVFALNKPIKTDVPTVEVTIDETNTLPVLGAVTTMTAAEATVDLSTAATPPTTQPAATVTPESTVTPDPSQQPSSITIGPALRTPARCWAGPPWSVRWCRYSSAG